MTTAALPASGRSYRVPIVRRAFDWRGPDAAWEFIHLQARDALEAQHLARWASGAEIVLEAEHIIGVET